MHPVPESPDVCLAEPRQVLISRRLSRGFELEGHRLLIPQEKFFAYRSRDGAHTSVKLPVRQRLDQMRAAGVHPAFLPLPSLLRLPIQTALLVSCLRKYWISQYRFTFITFQTGSLSA